MPMWGSKIPNMPNLDLGAMRGGRCHHGPMWGSRSLPKVYACIQVLIHASKCLTDLRISTIMIRMLK